MSIAGRGGKEAIICFSGFMNGSFMMASRGAQVISFCVQAENAVNKQSDRKMPMTKSPLFIFIAVVLLLGICAIRLQPFGQTDVADIVCILFVAVQW